MYVIIAGCGDLGAELARQLSEEGEDVVVIDRDRNAFSRLGPAFDGLVVEGIPIDSDVLKQAGADRADALAAVTGSDQVNLMVGQVAMQVFGVSKVVVHVSDPQLEDTYRRHGLMTIRPGKSAVAQVRSLLGTQGLVHLLTLGAGEAQLVEFKPVVALFGQSLDRLAIPGKCQPVGIMREGNILLPDRGLQLQPGDLVLAVVRLDAHAAVSAWAHEPTTGGLGGSH